MKIGNKGKRIVEASGFVCGYANDPDRPQLNNHLFVMFNVLQGNELLENQFKSHYGNMFVMAYLKNIDFIKYKIYVFKRDLDIINEVLALGDIKFELPLEDDNSLYLPDDYSIPYNGIKL